MKTWNKPKLLILQRERPRNSVLDFCKTNGGYGYPGPSRSAGCTYIRQVEIPCIIPPEPPPPGTAYQCGPTRYEDVNYACAAVANS